MYPEEADRFFPGTDTAHLGGDVWVADAAMAMMEHENWSGMFVTLGAYRQGRAHVGGRRRHGGA